jgi:hypothetical protein
MSLVKNAIKHPVIPLLVGGAVALEGSGNVIVRGAALLLCGAWFSYDVGCDIFKKSWKLWRGVVLGAICGGAFISIGYVMQWLLRTKLEEQRNDVYQHLTSGHDVLSVVYGDPMSTMFSVTNGGLYDISKNNQLTCYVKYAAGNNEKTHVDNFTSGYLNKKMHYYPGFDSVIMPRAESILKSGDTESSPCLSYLHFVEGTRCVDMTLIFSYALETQPNLQQKKMFRLVTVRDSRGEFRWSGEPLEDQRNFCDVFDSKLMPP